MVRPAVSLEMVAVEKTVCYSWFARGGSMSHHAGTQGKHQGWSGGRGSKGKTQATAFVVISTGKPRHRR